MGGYLSNPFSNKTKGFTLIELLAVIVVLAIIALIAVPIVLNIIEKARQGAAVSSARSYIKATETYVLIEQLNKRNTLEKNNKYNVTTKTTIEEKTYEAINDLVEVKGNKPSGIEDYIVLGDTYNVVEAKLTINGYEILIENDEVVSITKNGKTEVVDNETITLNQTDGSVEVGSTIKLTATVTGNGNKEIRWTSSDESVATVDSTGLVTGIKEGNVVITATTSNGKSDTANITIYKTELLSSVVNIGDYVAYDAGEWAETKEIPTSQGQFGGYTAGQNKSNSVSWCFDSNTSTTLKGWRVLSISGNHVTIVHAGHPECYYGAYGYNSNNITNLNNRASNQYLNTVYAESAHHMTYDEAVDVTGSIGDTTNDLRYIGESGTTSNSADYWLASQYDRNRMWHVYKTGKIDCADCGNYGINYVLGIRPVIVLKSTIKTTGKTTDAVDQEAWQLIVP